MKYKLLGKSGLRVSEICLGAMTFGDDWGWGANKDESRVMFDAFLEAGGNFIDTANVYTNGSSEKMLGEFIQAERTRIVLATKYTNAMSLGKDPNAGGNQRKNMVQSVEASLKRLNTDYIDVLWMHIWDKLTPVEEVMHSFETLIRQGKVLYIGISDAPAWWIARANTLAELRGWTQFVGLQIEYSLLERTPERELLPMAKELGLTVTAWSPLAGGILTGKYLDETVETKEARYGTEEMKQFMGNQERGNNIARVIKTIAEENGASAAQVALAWLRYRDNSIIPIIGTRKLAQLEDNLASLKIELNAEQLRKLDEVSKIELGFPHDFYEREMIRNFVYAGLADQIERR
jgi:aryl-alcohol dehydrogenase-like predicted oxidoreductase